MIYISENSEKYVSFPYIRKQAYEQEHNHPSVVQYNNGNPRRLIVMFPLLVRLFSCPPVGT
jgi:hypothetical protein